MCVGTLAAHSTWQQTVCIASCRQNAIMRDDALHRLITTKLALLCRCNARTSAYENFTIQMFGCAMHIARVCRLNTASDECWCSISMPYARVPRIVIYLMHSTLGIYYEKLLFFLSVREPMCERVRISWKPITIIVYKHILDVQKMESVMEMRTSESRRFFFPLPHPIIIIIYSSFRRTGRATEKCIK